MTKQEIIDKHLELLSKENKKETEAWILSLTDEDFEFLVSQPFITQAKIHYKKLREENKKSRYLSLIC